MWVPNDHDEYVSAMTGNPPPLGFGGKLLYGTGVVVGSFVVSTATRIVLELVGFHGRPLDTLGAIAFFAAFPLVGLPLSRWTHQARVKRWTKRGDAIRASHG